MKKQFKTEVIFTIIYTVYTLCIINTIGFNNIYDILFSLILLVFIPIVYKTFETIRKVINIIRG